jgi:CTP:molybdopterin cytidylyltransferase MocA
MPAVLLAAGASRRMGAAKALLPWRGEPLIRHGARALYEGGAARVIVVVAPGEEGRAVERAVADVPGVVTVVNQAPERGMLSSVQAGLGESGTDFSFGFLVAPCDLPRLEPIDVETVLYAMASAPPRTLVIAPAFAGKRGHPTWFSPLLRGEIMALESERFGLNEIVRRHAARTREVAAATDGVLRDADTPEEWDILTRQDKEEAHGHSEG